MAQNTQMENRRQNGNGVERVSDRPTVAPRVDVYENEKEILLVADLPGVEKEDLNIQVEKDTLVLEARRAAADERAPLFFEYRKRDYRRVFLLPPGLDYEKIDARLAAGVLSLSLPKQESLRPRRIAVRAN